MRPRYAIAGAAAVLVVLLVVLVPTVRSATTSGACGGSHWVGSWGASPQSSSLGRPDAAAMGLADGGARVFSDQTLRMVVTLHAGGSAVRIHLGNRYGRTPLTVGATTVGVRSAGASLVPGSMRSVTFDGSRRVDIPSGEEAVSDPIPVEVAPFAQLAISLTVTGSHELDYHQWAQSTHYAAPAGTGDHAEDEGGDVFTEQLTSSYGVTAVDVLAPASVGAVVTLGDSITDGIGSTPNTDQRWPDHLARRLRGALSVVNAGIAGNHVATSGLATPYGIGPAARDRVAADALDVAGVTDLFVYEGINDIFMSDPATDPASKIIAGYTAIIASAHTSGVRVIGATITPAGMGGAKEAARQAVNEWIRGSRAFDAVVDFDAVVRDPSHPARVRPELDASMAHLTDAGYSALARSVDPALFQGTGCT